LIDPARNVVIVLQLEANQYAEVGEFRDSDRIISPTFSGLQLTAEEVLRAGR
ncbi:Uma2 family endonuclease, partial [Pseudanabaenaceae cyanobacterium LEGE 13415]|nr:Uma2 family endonuclease [Pseudanabaenaceae cyanobacterium LEGE 13415]